MRYVDWVEIVLDAFVRMGSDTARLNGWRELSAFMGIEGADDAMVTALQDLDALGLMDASEIEWLKETQNTRLVRAGASVRRDLWPTIVGLSLDPDQLAFLDQLVTAAERAGDTFADVDWVDAAEVYSGLGWAPDHSEPFELTRSLEALGLVRRDLRLGGYHKVYPTYKGVVRVRERVNTEWWARLVEMAGEWETTSVEFKERLAIGSEKQNAEFARDVISLANSKASGPDRFLILGFSDKTRELTTPFRGEFDQNRLEQVLNAYAEPAPPIRLFTVEDPRGIPVGVIEVRREPTLVPHAIRHGGGKITAGQIFVRHGSQVEEPTSAELEALNSEGRAARTQA